MNAEIFILSAPSGAGKSTLCKAILKEFPELCFSISHTTRNPRPGEKNGVEYYFIGQDEFVRKIEADAWAEWAEVHGNYYGTSAEFLDRCLAQGKSVLLDIDVQGTLKILKKYPDAITIFIMPPSSEALKQRLRNRGSDSEDVIAKRLKNAEMEMAQKGRYRHIIVNDDLSEAISVLTKIIESAKHS
jgi:guanylate kinase